MEQIVVGMADCRIGDVRGQVLTTYALGSCIGLVIHDAIAAVGGLLHFMLPDSAMDPARGRRNPYMFADTGIPMLLEQLAARGALKRRLEIQAIGGAQMMDDQNIFEIGKRNYLATRRILSKLGLLLHGEAVGGNQSRTLRLEVGSGRVWLLEAGAQRELLPNAGKAIQNGLPRLDR
jgi:chemotaxis protein CheD